MSPGWPVGEPGKPGGLPRELQCRIDTFRKQFIRHAGDLGKTAGQFPGEDDDGQPGTEPQEAAS